MTDDSKFDSYLKKLVELSDRKIQIERATAATIRAARRDKVSIERLKEASREQYSILKERSSKVMKADVEREKATIAPPELKHYDDDLDLGRFGIADNGDIEMDDLIRR